MHKPVKHPFCGWRHAKQHLLKRRLLSKAEVRVAVVAVVVRGEIIVSEEKSLFHKL